MSTSVISKVAGTPDSSVSIVESSNTQVVATGTVIESAGNLAEITIPGGLMGANDALRLSTLFSLPSANAGTTQAVIRVGGATNNAGTIWFNNSMGNTILSAQHIHFIANNNSTSAQKGFTAGDEEAHRESTSAIVTASVDTSADWKIWINAIVSTAADVVNLERYMVELIRS